MRESYLEVTYRLGRGRKLIGIEILAPQKMSVARMNRILRELGELAPLRAA